VTNEEFYAESMNQLMWVGIVFGGLILVVSLFIYFGSKMLGDDIEVKIRTKDKPDG
jgi:hypothetical protein